MLTGLWSSNILSSVLYCCRGDGRRQTMRVWWKICHMEPTRLPPPIPSPALSFSLSLLPSSAYHRRCVVVLTLSLCLSLCVSPALSTAASSISLSLSLTCLLALSLTRTLSYQRIVHCLASPYNTPANSPSLLS